MENALAKAKDELGGTEASARKVEEGLRRQLLELVHKCQQSEHNLNSARTSTQEKLNKKLQDADGKAEATNAEAQKLKDELKAAKESLLKQNSEFLKEKALREQQMQFVEQELTETKQQLVESRRTQEQMVWAMKTEESSGDDDAKQC